MAKDKQKKKSNKKLYLFTFLFTLMATLLIFGSITAIYIKSKEARYKEEIEEAIRTDRMKSVLEDDNKKHKSILEMTADLNTLEGLVSVSKRINILLLGTDGGRADTIILASYEPDNHLLDFVTVPRDTYHKVPGYDYLGQHKINAVFGFGKKDGGGDGMKTQVSQILGVPIHYYVVANYQSISAIVNTVGGVEVNIDQYMYYDDPQCNPPLHINFAPGVQVLNGQQAIEYLRWRKNNDGTADTGDVTRTQRQIQFVKTLIKTAISSFKYEDIINTCYKYVETDMPLDEVFEQATTLFGFDPATDIETHLMPGEVFYTDLSYYRCFEEDTEKMMIKIYKKGLVEEEKVKPKKKSKTKKKKKEE